MNDSMNNTSKEKRVFSREELLAKNLEVHTMNMANLNKGRAHLTAMLQTSLTGFLDNIIQAFELSSLELTFHRTIEAGIRNQNFTSTDFETLLNQLTKFRIEAQKALTADKVAGSTNQQPAATEGQAG